MQSENSQNIKKTLLPILALLTIVTILTILFKYTAKIDNIALKIVVTYSIYLGLIGLVFSFWRLEKRSFSELGFTNNKLHYQILIGIGIALILSFLIGALPILIGGSSASLIGGKVASPLSAIYSIATNLIFIGTCEELIFRGYIQTKINELTPKHRFVGVLIAAALFGLWHIINGFWMQVIFTFFIGCAFGFCRAYLKNCSLLSVIIAHGLYNALLVIIRLLLLH